MAGIDYTKELEITQDKMTDELFAAARRGDEAMVFGITSFGRNMGARMAPGSSGLTAAVKDKKYGSTKRSRFLHHINLGPLTNVAMAETLLFETNGNVELAKLLAAKLQVNTLMSMDGNYGDDIAREMGAYGLSEAVRESQREEQNREVASQQEQLAAIIVKEKDKSVWQSLFGEKEPVIQPIEITPEQGEASRGFFSKFTRSLSKVFGMAAEDDTPAAQPLLQLVPAPMAMAFAGPRLNLSGPKMF